MTARFQRKRRNGHSMHPGAMFEHVVLGGDPPELKPPPPLHNDPQMKWGHLLVLAVLVFAMGVTVWNVATS